MNRRESFVLRWIISITEVIGMFLSFCILVFPAIAAAAFVSLVTQKRIAKKGLILPQEFSDSRYWVSTKRD